MNDQSWVINDPQAMPFRRHRSTMADPQILELERRRIFDVCWLYFGHESGGRAPGDFKTRIVSERPVIFCRDSKDKVRVFINTCRHRGSIVCREAEGNTKNYTC